MKINLINDSNYNRAKSVEQLSAALIEGKIDLSDIKKEMKVKNFDDEEIRVVVKLCDRTRHRALIRKINKKKELKCFTWA